MGVCRVVVGVAERAHVLFVRDLPVYESLPPLLPVECDTPLDLRGREHVGVAGEVCVCGVEEERE